MEEHTNNFIQGLIAERIEYYHRLPPEQRKEADVQRAYRVIAAFANSEPVCPELLNSYRGWLAENYDRDYIKEAISRFFDAYFCVYK
jgi:hypothetical protein